MLTGADYRQMIRELKEINVKRRYVLKNR